MLICHILACPRSQVPNAEPGLIFLLILEHMSLYWNLVKSGFDKVMIGPVPCVLAHDILYMELREILYQRGRVVTMFLHKVSQFSLFVLD